MQRPVGTLQMSDERPAPSRDRPGMKYRLKYQKRRGKFIVVRYYWSALNSYWYPTNIRHNMSRTAALRLMKRNNWGY